MRFLLTAVGAKALEEDVNAVYSETGRRGQMQFLRKSHVKDASATTTTQMTMTWLGSEVISAVAAFQFQLP